MLVDNALEQIFELELSARDIAGQCCNTVVKPSVTAGWGLHAGEQDIRSGQLVAIMSWGKVSREYAPGTQKVRGGYQRYCSNPDGESAWRGGCANEADNAAAVNCVIVEVPPKGRRQCVMTVLVAVCTIRAGEEVLVDYGVMEHGEASWPHRECGRGMGQ